MDDLTILNGKRVKPNGVTQILNGWELVWEDGSILRVSVAWMEFEPGKQEHISGGKAGRSSGEGAG